MEVAVGADFHLVRYQVTVTRDTQGTPGTRGMHDTGETGLRVRPNGKPGRTAAVAGPAGAGAPPQARRKGLGAQPGEAAVGRWAPGRQQQGPRRAEMARRGPGVGRRPPSCSPLPWRREANKTKRGGCLFGRFDTFDRIGSRMFPPQTSHVGCEWMGLVTERNLAFIQGACNAIHRHPSLDIWTCCNALDSCNSTLLLPQTTRFLKIIMVRWRNCERGPLLPYPPKRSHGSSE